MIQRLAGIAVLAMLSGMALVANAESGDPQQGKVKFQGCIGCHAQPLATNAYPTFKFPKLAGQHPEYIVAALKAYKSGERSHKTMTFQAGSLSEQDMLDIAAYLATLDGQ
ncbi:c-type cytochrome [Candidatus Macondimonas diazotrophica]|jgi:cytochrome c553|uniref:Cytochrome c n=1 Tax=Candidatus Macondimonas diazotrophica TaxID=2305248 RepID=A0A4Z0F7R5_9GAMM|nr:cytochrome c [Candidatus Macondimonas diazotrophica]NCU01679.1 cytochrome c [Candidatus Macondimonas diazotrophica]TFZ81736.1 cytochrome c [Candidatus Macondimonas diazotrophica]HBG51665.1 cytochrome C [Gammaproteobacteria bacterium]